MTEERAQYHVDREDGGYTLPAGTLLPYADPDYQHPNEDDVREVLRVAGLTGSQAADLVGVATGRTVRKWTGGTQKIPYSAWHMLLVFAGLVEPKHTNRLPYTESATKGSKDPWEIPIPDLEKVIEFFNSRADSLQDSISDDEMWMAQHSLTPKTEEEFVTRRERLRVTRRQWADAMNHRDELLEIRSKRIAA